MALTPPLGNATRSTNPTDPDLYFIHHDTQPNGKIWQPNQHYGEYYFDSS